MNLILKILFLGLLFSGGDEYTKYYKESTFVFEGKVTGLSEFELEDDCSNTLVEFEVLRIFKGQRWNRILIVCDSLSDNYRIGETYLLYSDNEWYFDEKGRMRETFQFKSNATISESNIAYEKEIQKLTEIVESKWFGKVKKPHKRIVIEPCNCGNNHL